MTTAPLRLLSADGDDWDGGWIETVFKVAEQEAFEGLRLELIEGEIIVSGVPDGHHEHILSRIARQITRLSIEEMDISGHKGVQVPIGGGCPKDHVIPALTAAPADAELFRHAEGWMPPGGITLVVEVTSSNARTDREGKRRCYARAAPPVPPGGPRRPALRPVLLPGRRRLHRPTHRGLRQGPLAPSPARIHPDHNRLLAPPPSRRRKLR